jgi:hypothetical protein
MNAKFNLPPGCLPSDIDEPIDRMDADECTQCGGKGYFVTWAEVARDGKFKSTTHPCRACSGLGVVNLRTVKGIV